MDLKVYYRKIREIEAAIEEPDAVIVSAETPDGGRAGVCKEVSRRLAATLVVEGKGRLASAEEAEAYRSQLRGEHERALRAEAENKIRVALVPEGELALRKMSNKPQK